SSGCRPRSRSPAASSGSSSSMSDRESFRLGDDDLAKGNLPAIGVEPNLIDADERGPVGAELFDLRGSEGIAVDAHLQLAAGLQKRRLSPFFSFLDLFHGTGDQESLFAETHLRGALILGELGGQVFRADFHDRRLRDL